MSDVDDAAAEGGVSVPLDVRMRLARPAVQVIADDVDVEMLHIKGDAVDRALRPIVRVGTDIDALVRPAHVARLDAALRAHGWKVYSTFIHGSPFGHAQTYLHPTWGYFDLHRLFPGIRLEPALAFDVMWADRSPLDLPGAVGNVPSREMQATLLVLNAARDTVRDDPIRRWIDEPGLDRADVNDCVAALDARVAFAAASGDLEKFRGERDYALWRVISEGGTRTQEWWARIRAADTVGDAVRIAARAPMVNVEQLEHDLGRPPTRRDIVAAFVGRWVRAAREATGIGRGRERR